MRVLIIAGPHEGDRLRREASAAGLESVAVEPSGNLASWIRASDPAVIVLAPAILHPDPAVAVEKVRAASGTAPLLLVADAAEADLFRALANAVLIRPVTEATWRRAVREVTGEDVVAAVIDEAPSGPVVAAAIATETSDPLLPPRSLRPLVVEGRAGASGGLPLFAHMAELIDATFDEELSAAAQGQGTHHAPEGSSSSPTRVPGPAPGPASLPEVVAGGTLGGPNATLDLASLFGRLYLARASGRLTLTDDGGVERALIFEQGHPVLAASSRSDERMGSMLVREGRLSTAVVRTCGEEAVASRRRLGAVLVERGHLRAAELPQVVRRHHEDIIYKCFDWEPVRYRFGGDESAASEKVLLALHPAALLLEGLRRKVSAARTLDRLGGPGAIFRLRATPGTATLLDAMGLSAEERRAALFLDGARTLTAVREATVAPLPTLAAIVRTLFVLDQLDVVRPGEEERLERERDAAVDRERVMAAYALVEEADYFRFLGVPPEASRQEIATALARLQQAFSRESLDPSAVGGLKAELALIHEVLEESWRVLGDDERRSRYKAALGSTMQSERLDLENAPADARAARLEEPA